MPIYEYGCQKCGKVSEYMQSMKDEAKTECEHCGGPLERLISRSAFHLKGGGWYKDLYSSASASSGSSDSGGSTDASSGSSSSDSASSSDSGSSSSSSGSADSGSTSATGSSASSSGTSSSSGD